MGKRDQYQLVPEDDPNFARFWANYPNRVGKKDARRAWAQLKPTAATVDRMVATLGWQCQQPAWTREHGQYVPHPATWLRAERWDDEPPAALQPQLGAGARTVMETLLGDGPHG